MSAQTDKRKEDACMEAGSTQGGAAAVGAAPFAAMAAQLTPKRAVSYIRVSTREQA